MPFDRKKTEGGWPTALRFLLLLVTLTLGGLDRVGAQEGAPGITQRTVFPAFDPNAPACSPPPGLNKVLGYVQENDRDFLQGVDHGLAMAARDRGLEYRRVLAQNDVAKAVEQIQSFLAGKVGGLVATSSDPAAVSHSLQQTIWSGAFVGTIVPPPATLLLNAPQYATGKVLADAAIAHINARLGGKANVVLLTQDTMEFLAPRFEAMRDGLNAIPGVTIVADIAPRPVTKEGGFETMKTILLANPRVDVVLGGDAVVLGALQALRAAGKDRPDQFLGGIDGEPEAVAEIKKGDSPYKASISLSSPVFGYAMGQFAADWLEGKSVPQAMDILPIALTSSNMAQYEADLANPAPVFADPVRRNTYLKMYGNICYDTRDRYVNFPWSSEQK
ncbi:sugar ABC transporter substrate-binding protein [Mesorhizobium sp. PAMC28654]|uniref:sugar ABC transporter substrate-binding protein n=1 Tax=Mesorhizobium sp. PAMC28654 TaxID=2880934 RepID=UPI001D0AEAFB|nr:sugar ABC transporter substrate-binding protein [Mesorhizobium sp. PAMC28654]UDL89379.1 sugar ABC transporter substrate-binding protein [Mesorhizobium sp. PAMC28654]